MIEWCHCVVAAAAALLLLVSPRQYCNLSILHMPFHGMTWLRKILERDTCRLQPFGFLYDSKGRVTELAVQREYRTVA